MADDPLTQTFAAPADPTRRAVLIRPAEDGATVNEVAEPFDMSLQAVSEHLEVLEAAGLISPGRDAPAGPTHSVPSVIHPGMTLGTDAATTWPGGRRASRGIRARPG